MFKSRKWHVLPAHPCDCQRPCEGQAETGSQSSPVVAPPAWRPSRCPTHHGRVSANKKKKYKMKPLKTLKATNAQFLNVYCNLSFRKHYKGHTYFDVLENDTPSSLILVFHQFFSMFPFFIWWILEELAESWKGHIISIEVVGL